MSFNTLHQPHHLIMQPWIHFRVKSLVKSLQSDTLTQAHTIFALAVMAQMLPKCTVGAARGFS